MVKTVREAAPAGPGTAETNGAAHPVPRSPGIDIDLSRAEDRVRVSGAAGRGFRRLMRAWNMTDATGRALLGGVCEREFATLDSGRELSAATLERISHLLAMFEALRRRYGEADGDAWMSRPNAHPLFGGVAPAEHLTANGLPAFKTLRRELRNQASRRSSNPARVRA